MECIQESEPNIELLNLSVRSYNCLKRNNISSIKELLDVSREDLIGFRNLGAKSLEEITDITNKLLSGEYGFEFVESGANKVLNNSDLTLLEFLTDSDKPISKVLFYDENRICKENLCIEEMQMSVRAENALMNNGIKNISQLLELNMQELNKLNNLGNKTRNEIIEKVKTAIYCIYEEEDTEEIEKINEICNVIFEEYEKSLVECDMSKLKSNIFISVKRIYSCDANEINSAENDINNLNFLKKLYKENFMETLIKSHIYKIVQNNRDITEIGEIRQSLPNHLRHSEIIDLIVNEMVQKRLLDQVSDGFRIWYPKLDEYIVSLEDEKKKTVLNSRFQGKTLEETGNLLGITRERIRQIEKKALDKIPRVREDDYKELFERYEWNSELFKHTFNEIDLVYGYLKSKYILGNISMGLILEDEDIPVSARLRAERIIYKNYILVGSSRIKKDRHDILDYILRTYCIDGVTSQDLSDLYYMFLEDFGLENREEMMYPSRYYETTLANSKKVLWKQGKKLRYFNFSEIDNQKIINALNLEQYKDVEYSSVKFFNDYHDVMEEWDIRDEYELHNLMKKVFADSQDLNINLSRMPNIEFGKPDRDMQVLDILLQVAPIGNYEFAQQYEQEYGVKAETVLANYCKCIDEFYHNGVYSIDYEVMPSNEFDRMKELLVNDIYAIKNVKYIYAKAFPNSNIKLINSYNLKRLGFRVITNLIYSDNYTNSEQYFRTIITENDIFDATLLDSQITCSPTYYHVLQMLKSQFDIVEFLPNKFVNIRRLEQKDITKDKLQEFINAVYEFGGEELFTIQSLRLNGFEHQLDELGFDDWFYSGLIRCDDRFRFRRLEGNILFRRGTDIVAINDLVEYIVCKYRSIDIYDLIDIIRETYGIIIEKFKLTYIAKEKELYYNAIMEKVYIDYDKYFEEA